MTFCFVFGRKSRVLSKVKDQFLFNLLFIAMNLKCQYIVFLLAIALVSVKGQPLTNIPHIQSAKYSAVAGQQFGITVTPEGDNFVIQFDNAFLKVPEVGISIYNLKFEYNPRFSVRVIEKTQTAFAFRLQGSSNIFNELFVMYIASDEEDIGIFVPERQITSELSYPDDTQPERTQNFTFNFKSNQDANGDKFPIFPSNTNINNIRISVYLTGISSQSETIVNGYSINYHFMSLNTRVINSTHYIVQVGINSQLGDVQIDEVQFTVVYFNVVTMINGKYQIDSNQTELNNFGGTLFKTSQTTALRELPENSKYANQLKYFFGINVIECNGGDSINLLAVERFNIKENGKIQNLLLTMETQGNTQILKGGYYYIQYKTLKCGEDGSFCTSVECSNSSIPSYEFSENQCYPCFYTCQDCLNDQGCIQCPPTRKIDKNRCICIDDTFYDQYGSRQCKSCFQFSNCQTCERKGVCVDCFTELNFKFNPVLATCQCAPGYYEAQSGLTVSQANLTCSPCPENCIYCRNQTYCEGCLMQFFLNDQVKAQNSKTGKLCSPVCNKFEIFSKESNKCENFDGDTELFNQLGRFSYDWSYQNNGNELIINLLFSQRNPKFYYYEDGVGYSVMNSSQQTSSVQQGTSTLFYDDGNNFIGGYKANEEFSSSAFNQLIVNSGEGEQIQGIFDDSALKGEYYGLGQARFFRQIYQNKSKSTGYLDEFNIPYGKHKLKNITEDPQQNSATDALRKNLVFKIGNQVLPYTIKAKSKNNFQLTVRPETSYLASTASLEVKNPSLIRSSNTPIQTPVVSKELDRFDLYTQAQFATAESLRDRNASLVQILWGICKYLLFVGFGWPVMPLMLIMQYIMGHNYIDTQLPLNLDYFLASFSDFRNPSILFNPERNDFDATVVNHGEIYKKVKGFNEFDRGIDFMKNSFQFFFTPLLAFGLLFLLIMFNFLLNFCNRDIPLISNYLQPRAGHLAGAYTLAQALPVSFFFFGQLNDTRYNHPNSPNMIYPSFNTGMAYASFFASAIIPLLLLAKIYEKNNIDNKVGTFFLKTFSKNKAHVSNVKFQNINQPIWGGNPGRPASYGFGSTVFYLPLLAGFFLAFFSSSYPWQFTGLLLCNVLFFSFAAASDHFDEKVFKYYFLGVTGLMIIYELVHAGIGSNRALSTYDQWNTGYLGIGLIYAMLLSAIVFSGYLLYRSFKHLYDAHRQNDYDFYMKLNKEGPDKLDPENEEGEALRNQATGRDKRKNTLMKSKVASQFDPGSDDRLIRETENGGFRFGGGKGRQGLPFNRVQDTGSYVFYGDQNRNEYQFPSKIGKQLLAMGALQIDSQNIIYNKGNNERIGRYQDLIRNRDEAMMQPNSIRKVIDIKGVSYDFDNDGDVYIVRNRNTGTVRRMSEEEFTAFKMAASGLDVEIVKYNEEDHFVEGPDEKGYYILRNMGDRSQAVRITEEVLINLRKEKKNITSIMQSQKSMKSNVDGNSLAKSTQQIVSHKKIYQIEGIEYEQIKEQDGIVHLYSRQKNQTITYPREELDKRVVAQFSSKKIIEEGHIFKFDDQPYEYQGATEDGRHKFYSRKEKKLFFLTDEQFMVKVDKEREKSIKESKGPETLFVESRVGKNFSSKAIKPKYYLKYVGIGDDGDTYKYEGQGRECEIPQGIVNHKLPVYFDYEGNLCQSNKIIISKDEMDEEDEEEDSKKVQIEMVRTSQKIISRSNNSIASSVNLTDLYKSSRAFDLTFLSPTYGFSDKATYSESDVLHRMERVRGDNVEKVIEQFSKDYPKMNIMVVDSNDPKNVWSIEQS